jgi:hypothetical protein
MPFALRQSLLPLALAAFCALPSEASAAPVLPDESALAAGGYRWLDEGPWTGPIYMVISIDRQMVHVYAGDRLIGAASVSTGMKGHRTPTGEYPILQKRQWHRSNLYSNAPMPFMQRLTWDGIALHAGHNPGYPASHGCIRLPHAFARRLFEITQLGTLVSVTADRLSPALMLDTLVMGDPESTVVTFSSRSAQQKQGPEDAVPANRNEKGPPTLEVDPAIFVPRFSR